MEKDAPATSTLEWKKCHLFIKKKFLNFIAFNYS